jgi:PucR family transcriptional regulator, purine catabolism regulatory protein
MLPPVPTQHQQITVRSALELDPLKRGVPEVLAGAGCLDTPIRWVHAGEVDYMATMLRGGELLLCTGMGLTDGAPAQRRFVAGLAERRIAGLVIELGPTFTRLPTALVAEAERRCLPLIALHREVPFVEVTKAIHEQLIGHQLVTIRKSDELYHRFTSLMLDGAGVPEVLEELARTIANPVLLERSGRGVVYHCPVSASDEEVFAAWEAAEQRLPGAPRTVAAILGAPPPDGWGRLVAVEMGTPISSVSRIALQRAADVIGLALVCGDHNEPIEERARSDFFTALLEQDLLESELVDRAKRRGFVTAPGERLLPAVLVRSRPGRGANGNGSDWGGLLRAIGKELGGRRVAALVGAAADEGGLLVVLGLGAGKERAAVADQFAAVARGAAARVLGSEDGIVLCVGGAVESWTSARAELTRTRDASSSAAATSPGAWCDVTQPDVNRLLWQLADDESLRRFVDDRLSAILEHDSNRRSQLLETLEAYCEHGGRKTETARALHVQRQSLYHRLSRIEELVGGSLSDHDYRFGLHLAVRARRFILESGPLPSRIS